MIRARDFRAWQGLPVDCTSDRLAKSLPRSNPNEGDRQLGSDAIDVDWWPAEVAGYRDPIEVQVANGFVVRIDGIGPELAGGLPSLLEALGEPAGKLPYWDATKKIDDGEWVWPARGIAIYLGVCVTGGFRSEVVEVATDARRPTEAPGNDLQTSH